ncbi:unnamed protein product [Lampetra planeri]
METRQKALTRAPDKKADADATPEAGAPFPGDGPAAAGSQFPGPSGSSPPSGSAIQSAHARLADLLHAAASILDELTLGGAVVAGGGPGRRSGAVPTETRGIPAQNFDVSTGYDVISARGYVTAAGNAAAGSDVTSVGGFTTFCGNDVNCPGSHVPQGARVTSGLAAILPEAAASSEMRPPLLADILSSDGPTNATLGAQLASGGDYIPGLQQRLPSLQVFAAKGGDWAAFARRFVANAETARHRFASRRREADEIPLAYQSALMALAQAAYPRMDDVGLDTIVLEKMLLLARELRITIHIKDEVNLSSLRATH